MKKEDIYNAISSISCTQKIIVIAGASCSGKSTLAHEIAEYFKVQHPLVICQDDWFKNIEEIPKKDGYYNMECKDAFYGDEFCDDIQGLFTHGNIFVPKYDIKTNHRLSKSQEKKRTDLIIIEGLHTVYFLKKMSLPAIYVIMDTDREICAERRVERDIKFIPLSKETIRHHYLNIIYNNYTPELLEQKQLLSEKDFIIGGN